jgi:hypothetical protein
MKYYNIIGIFAMSLLFANCSKKKSEPDNWYNGGNLHSLKIYDWKKADEKNKLATCADFVCNIKSTKGEKYTSNLDMKADAVYLKNCIEETTIDETSNENKISEIAALCLVMKTN